MEQHRGISDVQIARHHGCLSTPGGVEKAVQLSGSRVEPVTRELVRARHQSPDQVGQGCPAAMTADLDPEIVVVD